MSREESPASCCVCFAPAPTLALDRPLGCPRAALQNRYHESTGRGSDVCASAYLRKQVSVGIHRDRIPNRNDRDLRVSGLIRQDADRCWTEREVLSLDDCQSDPSRRES
jgi:hypothetical protein